MTRCLVRDAANKVLGNLGLGDEVPGNAPDFDDADDYAVEREITPDKQVTQDP